MRIAFVLYPGLTTLDIVGPIDVLSRLPGAETFTVGTTTGAVDNDNSALRVVVDHHVDDVPSADIVVVPGGTDGTTAAAQDTALLDWLRGVDAGSTWTTSVCTGALVLAAAGLLDGRRATTHWAALDALGGFGAEPVAERVVRDGKYVTAAGVSAGIDMALTLAAEVAGPETAQLIQLAIEYDPDPPFDTGSPAKAGPELVGRVGRLFG